MIFPSKIEEVLCNNKIEFYNNNGKIVIKDEIVSMATHSFITCMFALLSDLSSADPDRSKFNKMTISTDGSDLTVICYFNSEIRTYRIRDGKISDKCIKELT